MSASPTTGETDDQQAVDSAIADVACLYRRIHPTQVVHEEHADGTKCSRPSSASFTDNATPMSLYEDKAGGGIEGVMKGHDAFYLVSFQAGDLRALGLLLRRTPEGGPGHCEAVGKKTGSLRTKLSKLAVWVVKPTAD